MIFRRLAQHLREQNWTAIFIEFVLLVLGVFLGIQVANWNEERVERSRELAFLGQLRGEILDNVEVIEYQLRYQTEVIAAGRRALAFLQSQGSCEDHCAGLLIDFFHASQIWGTPYARAKYEENQRLGFPTEIATRAPVDDFYFFINGWDAVTGSAPPYRERVRGHFTPDASEQLWGACWKSIGGRFETLVRTCEADLKTLDVQAVLTAIHADAELKSGLQFWLGQNLFAVTAMPEALQLAQTAIASIDRERGIAP